MAQSFRIVYSPEVIGELRAVFAFISQDSRQNARVMVKEIMMRIEGLKLFPLRQRAPIDSSKIRAPIHSLPVPPYVVYFRVHLADGVVRILQVRHGARRPPKRL